MLYKAKGRVQVYDSYIVAYINPDIVRFYKSLIPKWIYVNRQKYDAHITIVRKDAETIPNKENQPLVDGKTVWFYYDTQIKTCGTYYWMNVYSRDIEQIRISLGLSKCRFDCFHITLGNIKEQ
jgi:hypothetical protein